MNQPHIAIIDDGINDKFYGTGELKFNIQITSEGKICERAGYDTLMPSHGTTCAAIIKSYTPDVFLSSVKILDQSTHTGKKSQLIAALKWCMQNGIKLVNLSLGTVDFRDFADIERAAGFFAEHGGIIIAACNNRNIFTCPAALEKVIGVRCDISKTLKEREFIYNPAPPDGIEITACGSHQLIKYNGKRKITSNSNSFATP
ncbi:MAG: peptidase and in kexin sedolisin, partial [Eubacterium sp.]|nr:peptidase and in kexin sedolisin [Eubacterium sp.]